MDKEGGGLVLFDELSGWAFARGIQAGNDDVWAADDEDEEEGDERAVVAAAEMAAASIGRAAAAATTRVRAVTETPRERGEQHTPAPHNPRSSGSATTRPTPRC